MCTGSACSSTQDDPNSHNIIYEAVYPCRNKWYNIGSKLGADYQVLTIIGDDHPNNSVVCLRKTLDHLFKTNPPTMKDVIEALESPLIDNTCLARDLREKFVK